MKPTPRSQDDGVSTTLTKGGSYSEDHKLYFIHSDHSRYKACETCLPEIALKCWQHLNSRFSQEVTIIWLKDGELYQLTKGCWNGSL